MDQRHGLTKSASDRIVSILTSPPTASSQAELGDSEAAGDPDAATSIAPATHVAASLASAAHAAAALGGPTKAEPSSASPAEPGPPTASPDSHVARRPRPTATRRREWERTGNAALLAAALAQPTKEWLTPALDSPAVAPVAVAADAAMDTATGGQP